MRGIDARAEASDGDRPAEPLPRWYTSFFGREREVAAIAAALTAGDRLVTIVGAGGVGKTRLAVLAAEAICATTGWDTRFVALDVVADPAAVLPTIASALGLSDVGDRRDTLSRISEAAARGPRLLILDNLEHLLASAPDLRRVLDATAGLAILATSRAPLRLEPERVFLLDPLPLPEPGLPAAGVWVNSAVRLFVERGRLAGGTVGAGDADTVAEIVRRLDGLPLAIELAAARLWADRTPSVLLEQLAERLPVLTEGRRDTARRHRTLRDAIAWSYDLLSPEEQTLFRRLAVFAGGFHPEMADRLVRGRAAGGPYPYADGYDVPFVGVKLFDRDPFVAYDDGRPRSVARPLSPLAIDVEKGANALADWGLLQRTTGRDGDERFVMLETIREFGLEQLEASGEAEAVRHAHAAAIVAFAEASSIVLWSSLWLFWGMGRIEDELGNIAAAIAWAEDQGSDGAELVLRIADPLWPFFQLRGLVAEARHWLERAVAYQDAPPWPRSLALGGLGMLCWIQGDD